MCVKGNWLFSAKNTATKSDGLLRLCDAVNINYVDGF